ncbi:MAG: T9SS type A sorting domain-containing protein [Phycisphaerales bacterium]|nr:T9SS type A sorting domain-containing protein [Phycisphaerales bacterium]
MDYLFSSKRVFIRLFLFSLFFSNVRAFAQAINTIAGIGSSSFSGDGGLATSAELAQPVAVARDGSGNVYISDQGNHRIRKITFSTGVISTIAGSSTFGYSGDGGAAVSAKLYYPAGIAVDGLGNVYFADQGNHRIRKITTSTGVITTIAGTGTIGFSGDGGAATSAMINNPAGVAVDNSGNVYFSDQYNQRIRKITASTGNISTIAGTGAYSYSGDGGAATSATFQNPAGIRVDASGNIFIADLFNHVIRKITASTGAISTVAGTGTAGFSGDGGSATSANLNYPIDVSFDDSANLYISVQNSHRIRKVSASTGYINSVVGTGTAGYSGDGGLATAAQISYPTGIATDGGGNIYIADHENHRIRFICNYTVMPTVVSPVNYCVGATATALTASSTSLKWYTTATGGIGSTTAPTPSTASVGTTTYYVVSVSPYGCEGLRDSIKVTVNALPSTPTVTSPVTYCVAAAATALTATGTSLKWYTSATGGTSATTAPTPSTASAGTTNYYVSQTSSTTGCESARTTITVIVNSLPTAPTVTTPVNYCEESTASALTASGITLLWYTSATGGSTGSSTAPTPSTTVTGTTVYYVTQTTSCGESSRSTITVNVNAKPAKPSVITPVDYCQFATATALTATGTGLVWYTTATGGTGSGTAPTPSTAASGAFTYYVSQASSTTGCESNRETLTVNVTTAPVAPTVTTLVVYCIGATASALTATGTSLKWYTAATGGTGSSTAPTPSTVLAGTDTYYVSQTSASTGCESARSAIAVVINPLPTTPTVATPVSYCKGATAVALVATGSGLLWYTSATGGTGSSTSPTPSTSTVGATIYYVSSTNSCGESSRAAVSVMISNVPDTPAVTSPVIYCQGDTAAVALSATGTSLKWYTSPTGGIGSSTAPVPSTATAGTRTYYVSQSNAAGCESVRSAIVVIIRAAPAPPIVISPVHYCQFATATALTATGTGLVWYTSPTGGVGSTTAPIPNTDTVGSKTYYVSQSDTSSCPSLRAAITVIIHDIPSAPIVSTPLQYCQGEVTNPLTATPSPGDTLKWYTVPSGGAFSTTAPTPSSASVDTTNYYVSATSRYGCGEGARSSISIVVNAQPNTPTVVSPVSYCVGASSVAVSATGTSLKWYSSPTGGSGTSSAPTPSTGTATTIKYYVSQTSIAGCESNQDSIIVTINPVPAVPTVTTPIVYCLGAMASPPTASGTSLLWYTSDTGGTGSTTASTPSTASLDTIIYYVSQSNSFGCESARAAIAVNINSSPPAPTVTTPINYCQDATASSLTAIGTSLLWYTSVTGGTGSSIAIIPSTSSAGTTTYYVSQNTGCGESARTAIVVNINANPSAPTVPAATISYCQNAVASPLTATGTSLKWYTTATGGIGSTTAPTPLTTPAGTTTYYVSQTNSVGCESPRTSIAVTINATPIDPIVTTPAEYCSGSTPVALTASGTSLKWYTTATGGTGSSTAPIPSTSSTGATTYYVSQTSVAGCESERALINVIVYATPSAPTVGFLVAFCLGGAATPLTAIGPGLKWYTAATGGTGTTTAPTPSTASVGFTTYYVSQSSTLGCEGGRASILVTINPLPAAPSVITPVTYCEAATASALTATGTSLKWYTTATGGTGSATAPIPSTATPGSTTYYVSQTSSLGCEGFRSGIVATINPLPLEPLATSPITYCEGATASILTATGTTLKWYASASGGTASTTAPTPSTATSGTTTYYVSQTSSLGCEGSRASIIVNVNPLPTAPTVITPIVYCEGAIASALTATGSSLKWYTVATGGTASTTAPTPSTTTAGATTYYISQTTAASCESPRASIVVTINPLPTSPTVTSPIAYCQDATASPLTATGTSLKWYTTATGGAGSTTAPTPSTTIAGTTTYYVSQTNAASCEGPRASIVVTVNPLPTAPTVISPLTYCQAETASPLSATGTSLKWYIAATGGTSSSTVPTPSTTTLGTTTYYVSQTSTAGCEGVRSSIVVTVNPLPTAPTVSSSPITYCEGETATALSAVGTSLKWYPTATGSTGIYTTTPPTPSTTTAGTTVYYVSQTTAAGCEGSRIGITVIVNPLPAAPTVVSPIAYCQFVTPSALTAVGTSLKWYTSATGGTASTTAPTPSTSIAGTTTYYVSQTSAVGCESPRAALTVVVNLVFTKPAVVSPVGYCIGALISPLSATGIALKWYTTATGGVGSTTAPTPSTASVGSTTYYVSQTSLIDCESPRSSIVVNISDKPDVDINSVGSLKMVFCKYDSLLLSAKSSVIISDYQWYRNSILIPGATADTYNVSTNGYYKAVVKNTFGCENEATVYVYGDTLPDPRLSPTELLFCPNVNIILFCSPVGASYQYEWYKDSIVLAGDTLNQLVINKAGSYYVRVTDSFGCVIFTNASTAKTYPALIRPKIIRLDPILRLSSPFITYQWYRNGKPIAGAIAISYSMPFKGKYWCVVTDENDCSDVSDTVDTEQSTGIKLNVGTSRKIKIYPNPTQSKVFLEADFNLDLRVTDITGRLIVEQKDAQVIDMSVYADGVYIFTILSKEGEVLGVEKINKIGSSQ